ncbi:MAG: hypothetical protein LBS63_00630 [Prevotellaceae bacterium]|jgi:hypothetical protein|nr:hypothetical protein [Prevotellaceae bacterium]
MEKTFPSWKDELVAALPYLGHRNWVVVTDMAYPLQARSGIRTIYTDESYMDVLNFVHRAVEEAPHVKPLIYQDKELACVDERDAGGVDALRGQMAALLGNRVTPVPHEQLIARLDEVSHVFHVLILKTTLAIPYTSTFFELDCAYWDGEKEQALQKKMSNK